MIKLKTAKGKVELDKTLLKGEDGGYYIPSVSEDGNLSWFPTGEDMEIPEVVNIKGKDGKDGTNGRDGTNGKDGYTPVKGVDYRDGIDGKDGYTPIKDVDYRDGIDGYTPVKGVDYHDGKDGNDGYTPVKGVDYWTNAERAEMVNDVLAALPSSEGVGY